MKKVVCTCAVFLCAVLPAVPRGVALPDGQHPQSFTRQITKTVGAKYLLVLPAGYAAGTNRWPLLVFLHGSGESGDDLNRVKNNWPRIIDQHPDFPFLVAAPQCPNNEWWSEDVPIALVDELVSAYRVDEDRIYVTGISMGGHGAWAAACSFPDRFAAIAPICGEYSPDKAAQLRNVPVWAFHGEQDPVVPLQASKDMVDAAVAAGGDAKLTVFPGVGHDAWPAAYNNPELFRWMLQHRRGKPKEIAELDPAEKNFMDLWQAAYDYQRKNLEPALAVSKKGIMPHMIRRMNPTATPVDEIVTWILPKGSKWKVTPASQQISCAPGEIGMLQFEVGFGGSSGDVFPLPERQSVIRVGGQEFLKTSKPPELNDSFFLAYAPVAKGEPFTNAPAIDGDLSDAAWSSCKVVTDFRLQDGVSTSAYPTEVRIGYDKAALYFAFRCHQTNLDQLVLNNSRRDGNLWEDDSVEVFLDHRLDRKNYFHLIVNADGYLFDEIIRDRSWNAEFEAKTGREKDAWTLELRVPWASLGISRPGPGIKMGLEFVRVRPGPNFETSQWAPTLGDNHTPTRFGVLEFK
ncbi:MAG: sugar-binding protein [Verrucomicrobiota bacterium]